MSSRVSQRLAKSKAQLQVMCDKFNNDNPVGTAVDVNMDGGETRRTVTVSPADILSGHSAVIWLKGISGCYLLDRVTPVKGGEA